MLKYILLVASFWILNAAEASSFHLIELDEVRIDYIGFAPGSREPLITNNGLGGRELNQLLDLQITTTILDYFYWRGLVHSYTDQFVGTHNFDQFRSVGLNMEIGVRITSFMDIYAWHYSQHLLDHDNSALGRFPVQDGVGIHFYLYSKDRKDSLFDFR